MILNYSWAVWLAWFLAAFFVVNGLLNVTNFSRTGAGFVRWGSAPWSRVVNGLCDLTGAVMIAWYPARPLGLVFSMLACLAIGFVHLRSRDYRGLPVPVVLFALTLLTAWGLRLI